jgi:hypothetical protein
MIQQDAFELTNLVDMAASAEAWRIAKSKTFLHMAEIPTGTIMDVDGVQHCLEGDLLTGFIGGMRFAADMLASEQVFVTLDD